MTWIFTALILFPSGERDTHRAVFETSAACEMERQRLFLHMLQVDPMIRVQTWCRDGSTDR